MCSHFNVDPKLLRLTKEEDERIYNAFVYQFPNFDIDIVTTESLKSEEAKEVHIR